MRSCPPLALLLLLMGCNSHPATQVLVVLEAEPSLRADAAQIRVRVEGPDGVVAIERTDDVPESSSAALARMPLVPLDGDSSRTFRVVASLLDDSAAELARIEVVGSFHEDELREIHAWFDEACRGVLDCGDGRTCSQGLCVGACYASTSVGGSERSEPTCGECQQCASATCAPRADGSECGCPGTDRCASGQCVTEMPASGVWAGDVHSCALANRALHCWGSNRTGQMGTGAGSGTPDATIVEGGGWATGTAGHDHTCWLSHGGGRQCWGWNGGGQLGIGDTMMARYDTPTAGLDTDPDWTTLASGWLHSCGLTTEGRIFCWGSNNSNASGQETSVERIFVPTEQEGGAEWSALSSGGFHNCAIRRDGTIWCWGMNRSGELGVGDNADRALPVQSGCPNDNCINDWKSVAAGDFHTCAIREDGQLWCWGGGLNGQLGIGPIMGRSTTPVEVEMGGWRQIDAGESHTCGIREDGSLWCWGRNDLGQVGAGDAERRDWPHQVRAPGGDTWIWLGLGREHSCAVRSDQTLWCWGRNETGQLGLGFLTEDGETAISSPRRVCFPGT